jgi:hypothetical protein
MQKKIVGKSLQSLSYTDGMMSPTQKKEYVSGRHRNYYCSVSRWRPQKVDKRMVLEHTHGLFIT